MVIFTVFRNVENFRLFCVFCICAFNPEWMMKKLSMAELPRKTVEEFRSSEKMPVVAVLENVRSAYNVGSVFRTADAFGRLRTRFFSGLRMVPRQLGAPHSHAYSRSHDASGTPSRSY